jgi:serine/threonine-protein kinase
MHPNEEQLRAALAARYRIDREIGAGGMASVFLAHDLRHDREVAIKVLRPDVAGALGSDRFLREIAVTASLDHPNILPLLDSGDADGVLYYVMPFVHGESLRDRLTRERQLPLDDALAITREVSEALSYAHARGIVHRDVKPENIMLSGGHARVVDFGIARALSHVHGNTMTGTGIVIGSPAYMSPEQASADRELDGRSDVYAVGCVLFEMLAGVPPFVGPTQESVMRQHLIAPPPDVSQLRPTVPPGVVQALTVALAKAPADRFASPSLFATALAGGGTMVSHTPAPGTITPVRRGGIWIVLLLLALGLGGAYAWVKTRAPAVSTTRPLVVVLPFRNIGSPDDEYFADGITEEITARLSTISGIGTISRSTALSYKGSTKPLREIARELGATFVLEGTVRTERLANGGGQVRVTPELIRADTDTPLWTDRFTVSIAPGELFAVQALIAERVAGAFDVTLADAERAAVQRRETNNREAHDAYLKGRFAFTRSTEAGLQQAITLFEDAVSRDSLYARAYAALADAHAAVPYYPEIPISVDDAFARAESAARTAIRLDSTLAEGHAALAAVLADGRWRWTDAEQELQRALQLDPDNAAVRTRYGALLLSLGRFEQGVSEARRALALEPASAYLHHELATALTYTGQYEAADSSERRALALSPDFIFARVWMAELARLRGGVPEMGRALTQIPPIAAIGTTLSTMQPGNGSLEAGIAAIKRIKSPNPGLDAARQGWLLSAVGDTAGSLEAFERAVQLRSPGGVSALQFPSVERTLREQPRYQELLRTVGIVRCEGGCTR